MLIRRSTFRRIIAGLVVAIVAAITATVVVASNVTIQTPSIGTEELKIEGTVIGTYPLYSGSNNTTVTYPAYLFAPGTNGSYRLSIWQNTTPLAAPTWVEIHINHHWASDPNPTTFTFGPFLAREKMCETCPSKIVVQPETYQPIVGDDGVTYYSYFPILGALTSGPAALTQSDEVLFHGIAIPGGSCTKAGGKSCEQLCGEWMDFICDEDPDACTEDVFLECVNDCQGLKVAACKPCGDGFCSIDERFSQSCPADCDGSCGCGSEGP